MFWRWFFRTKSLKEVPSHILDEYEVRILLWQSYSRFKKFCRGFSVKLNAHFYTPKDSVAPLSGIQPKSTVRSSFLKTLLFLFHIRARHHTNYVLAGSFLWETSSVFTWQVSDLMEKNYYSTTTFKAFNPNILSYNIFLSAFFVFGKYFCPNCRRWYFSRSISDQLLSHGLL